MLATLERAVLRSDNGVSVLLEFKVGEVGYNHIWGGAARLAGHCRLSGLRLH